jgi:hypothetical protein
MRRYIEIDGKRYLWRDVLKLRREDREWAEAGAGILLAGYGDLAYSEVRRRSREARDSDRKAERYYRGRPS